jgi:hypothetical protein
MNGIEDGLLLVTQARTSSRRGAHDRVVCCCINQWNSNVSGRWLPYLATIETVSG